MSAIPLITEDLKTMDYNGSIGMQGHPSTSPSPESLSEPDIISQTLIITRDEET